MNFIAPFPNTIKFREFSQNFRWNFSGSQRCLEPNQSDRRFRTFWRDRHLQLYRQPFRLSSLWTRLQMWCVLQEGFTAYSWNRSGKCLCSNFRSSSWHRVCSDGWEREIETRIWNCGGGRWWFLNKDISWVVVWLYFGGKILNCYIHMDLSLKFALKIILKKNAEEIKL